MAGKLQTVLDNIENFIYLIDTYGFIPNGSHKSMLNRSQPPFLSLMVREIYETTKDSQWLEGAYDTLVKHGVQEQNIKVVHVPGTFELTYAANKLQQEHSTVLQS